MPFHNFFRQLKICGLFRHWQSNKYKTFNYNGWCFQQIFTVKYSLAKERIVRTAVETSVLDQMKWRNDPGTLVHIWILRPFSIDIVEICFLSCRRCPDSNPPAIFLGSRLRSQTKALGPLISPGQEENVNDHLGEVRWCLGLQGLGPDQGESQAMSFWQCCWNKRKQNLFKTVRRKE